jgi:hypothetical protein
MDGRVRAHASRIGDLEQRKDVRWNRGLRHGQGRWRRGRRAGHVRLVRAVAGRRDGQDAELGGVLDREREIVVDPLTVVGSERHVDDVEVVGRGAIAVRVDGPVDGPDEADAGAGRVDG